jgi:hypothetical protein
MGGLCLQSRGLGVFVVAANLLSDLLRPALDQIITQLMESSNAGRPVPATDEIIANLPREVLEEGCT